MADPLRIGIVGNFDRGKHSHWATDAAIFHAATRLGFTVQPCWVPTELLDGPEVENRLESFDGLWGAPGSPYASFSGMLRGIEFARRRDFPYLGTCGGFQYALIEFTRNVLGLPDADTAENGSGSRNIVITPVACALPGRPAGGPKMCGGDTVRPVAGTLLDQLCQSRELHGEYFCNFETNPDFVPRWEATGLRVAARGPQGEMRAFDLPGNRFFLATLFQPQLSSSSEQPHKIVEGYLRACAEFRTSRQRARALLGARQKKGASAGIVSD
jgi:CTP synthase (UTP-ammonia lyase)